MRAPSIAGLVLVVLLAGCTPSTGAPAAAPRAAGSEAPATGPSAAAAPAASQATDTALVPINVTNFGPSVNTAFLQYGLKKGYYRDEGLDVSVQFAEAAVGVQLVAAGHMDFSQAVGSSLAAAVRGAPIKIVFPTADRPLWWMYSQPSIKSTPELRGKTIGASSAGSSLTIVARMILEHYGIGPDDATLVNLASQQRLAALESGAADAAFLVAPYNLEADRAGYPQLFNSKDEGILLITEGLATSDTFLREKPDLVRRMLRASLRSLRGMRDDPDGAVDTIATFTEVSPDEARQIYELALPTWTKDGTTDTAAMQQSVDIMKQVAQVDGPVSVDQVFDLSIAREVAAAAR